MKLTNVDLNLTPAQLAELFCQLVDDDQAQFFVEVGKIAAGWTCATMQWHRVGRHLRDCECSTVDGRAVIEEIADGMKP